MIMVYHTKCVRASLLGGGQVQLSFFQAKISLIIPRQASGTGCVVFSLRNLYVYISTDSPPTQLAVFSQ